jgi:AsmA-like C-terminal region
MEQAGQTEGIRRSRGKRLALAGVSLLAATAVAIVLLLHHYWPFTQNQIVQTLGESFSGTVTIERFRSTYFPHPGCVAEGVVLQRQAGNSRQLTLARVERLTIQAEYGDLIFRPRYVARIVAAGLKLTAPLRGSFTGPKRQEAPQRQTRVGEVVADGAVVEIAREDGTPPLQFAIHALTLRSVTANGQLSYRTTLTNPVPPGEIESQGKFGPWNFEDPGQTPLSGHYRFAGADLSVFPGVRGTLASEDDFEGVLEQIHVRGTVDVPNFEVKRSGNSVPVRATFQADVNGTNGDLLLKKVNAVVLQTRVWTTGRIAGKPGDEGRKTTSLDFRVERGRIQDMLRLFVQGPTPPLTGATNFQAHVTVPPEGRPFLKELRLDGEFEVSGGHFTSMDTQKDVDTLSERGQGMKTKDVPSDGREDVLSKLTGRASLRNGVATLSDFYFEIPGAKAKVSGTYNLLDENVDLHGRLGTQAKLSQTTNGGFKSVLLKPLNSLFKGKHHEAVVYVKLTGTYSDPQAGFDLVGKRP